MTDFSNDNKWRRGGRVSRRVLWIGLAIIGAAVIIVANVHLVAVAFESQPDCVAHQKERSGEAGVYRAAKSGCVWRGEEEQ